MGLDEAVEHLLTAKRISGTRASFAKDNPIEWRAVEEYLTGGARPIGIITEMGLGLLEVEDARRGTPLPPPPGNPIPPGSQNLTISQGGTYSGSYNKITLATGQPTRITAAGFREIDAYHSIPGPGIDLQVDHCWPLGIDAYNSARWLTAQKWKRLEVFSNTIVNTRGIELWPTFVANPTTRIYQNYHRNIKGTTEGNSLNEVGNFVQLRVIWGGPSDGGTNPNPGLIEMYWNEIVNEHNKSNPEDVFSIYKTARTRIHDNLINGQTKPDSMTGSSQNSITIDPAGEPQLLFDNQILSNFVIDAYSVGMFGGNNNLMQGNYIVSDGYNGDTGQKMRYGYSGLFCSANGSGNVLKDNHVGYIGSQGRVDTQEDGGTWSGTVNLPNPITRQTELDHIAMFHQRAAAAGVVIGA